MQDDDWLRAEDYAEPRCLLCDEPHGAKPQPKLIPWPRVRERFDELTGRNDYAAAERHMLYWLEEARLGGDLQGQFQIHNELMGLYRKRGSRRRRSRAWTLRSDWYRRCASGIGPAARRRF